MPLGELNRLVAEAVTFTDGGTTERRHALIRQMATRFYPGSISLRQTAIRMAKDLRRYQQVRWRHDAQKSESEIEYEQDGKSTHLYKLMKATNGHPLSESRIAEVLAGRKCGKKSA